MRFRSTNALLTPYRRLAHFQVLAILAAIGTVLGPHPLSLRANTFNVTSFGAVANDNVDDLSAFAAAINAASTGDTIIVPSGNFLISGAVQPKTGLKIIGAGRDNTTITFSGG